jgi:ribonucrease Y
MTILTILFGVISVILSFLYVTQLQVVKQKKQALAQLDIKNDELKEKLIIAETKSEENIKLTKKEITLEFQQKIQDKTEHYALELGRLQSRLDAKIEEQDNEREHVRTTKDELREIKNSLLEKQRLYDEKQQVADKDYQAKLSEVAQLDAHGARQILLDEVENDSSTDLLKWQTKFLEKAKDEANEKAREIVALAIQRCSGEVANEFTLTTIKLDSDEQKGKIIGKGGRNIQWLEKTLGVEVVIDETPEVITISGFSSIRRHLAKRTIELLLEDGRIHPASIEQMYAKSQGEIAKEIAEAGQHAVNELGIYDFPAKLIRIIGRLKFRTSYGQNMLKHSVEMSRLAGLLAGSINAEYPHNEQPVDVMICMKGALLHDIGKAIDEETIPKGNHITLGEKVCDQFGLDWKIRKCISSHHDESYYDDEKGFCIEAALVDACDNISGGRLGARKETMEAYTERMEELEKIAKSVPGVSKSWIMRGSRELWVFFDTHEIPPSRMGRLTRRIAKKIESTVNYPGEIKVIGLWEGKVVEYAT